MCAEGLQRCSEAQWEKHKTAVDHWEVVTANRPCWREPVREEVAQRQGDNRTFHEANLLSSKQQEAGQVN
jgi:hypothetical protein